MSEHRSLLVIVIVITLFNEGKDIDYWSPSSFHNGPPMIILIMVGWEAAPPNWVMLKLSQYFKSFA